MVTAVGAQRIGRLVRSVPAVRQLKSYQRAWLGKDISAGIVLTGLLAPVGMAYATASGLPAVTGLYATIIPLLAYAVVGPSRIMVLGPDSSLTPLIAAAVVPLAARSPNEAMAIAGALSMAAGVICIVAGLARFGFISELLSAPVRYGYLNGIAVTIIVSQGAKLFGFSVGGESLVDQSRQFATALGDGQVNTWAVGVGIASVVGIVVLRSWSPRIPVALAVVLSGIAVALVFDLGRRGVPLVGDLPQGIPSPSLPQIDWETARALFGAALGVAFVSFADTSVVSRTMALRRHERVDANHELLALGIANVASGFFRGFPISASSSRTPVAEAAGSRTQLTGVTAAAVLLVISYSAPSAFRHLPATSLAAIVVAAAFTLIDLPALVRLLRVRRSEFFLSLAAFVAVALLGPVSGVVVAITLSVLDFLRRSWMPHTAELVRVDGLKGYHELERHPEGRRVPGLLLYRFDAPMYFANAHYFADDLGRRVGESPTPVTCVIITAEPMTDIDTTAADVLRELFDDLGERGIEVRFAELKGHVRDQLLTYDVLTDSSPSRFARTTGEAVKRYIADYGVSWTDWEDH